MSHPLRSDMTQDTSEELPMPAVTICNLSPFHKTRMNASDAFEMFLLRTSNLGIFEAPINFSDPSLAELSEEGSPDWFQNSAFKLSDMFLFCLFKGSNTPCQNWFTERITDWGNCFTFNSWKYVQHNKGPLKTSMTGSNSGLIIYLNVDQKNYIFNENIAAGLKVSRFS